MEKFIKFWKYLWGNKLTLFFALSTLIGVAFGTWLIFGGGLNRYHIFYTHQTFFKIVLSLIMYAYSALGFYLTFTKFGLENINELEERKAKRLYKKANRFTKEQRKGVLPTLKSLEQKLKSTKEEMERNQDIIKTFEILKNIQDVQITSEMINNYNKAQAELPSAYVAFESLKLQIKALKERL